MLKPENVATPATAATVAVPLSVPAEGFVPIAIAIMSVSLVTTLPLASSMLTAMEDIWLPAAVLPGCVVKTSCVGGPTVCLLAELHPATTRTATNAEIARIRLAAHTGWVARILDTP